MSSPKTNTRKYFFNNCNNSHTSPVYSGKKDTKHV